MLDDTVSDKFFGVVISRWSLELCTDFAAAHHNKREVNSMEVIIRHIFKYDGTVIQHCKLSYLCKPSLLFKSTASDMRSLSGGSARRRL